MEAQTSHAEQKVKAAAPLVEAALSTPISDLYAAANKGDTKADMTLGLALLADRWPPDTEAEVPDLDALVALEARVHAVGDTWHGRHPDKSLDEIDWDSEAALTDAEAAMLERIQAVYSANFWLSRSLAALSQPASGAECLNCQGNRMNAPTVVSGRVYSHLGAEFNVSSPVVWAGAGLPDADTAMTAIHCVESVRELSKVPVDIFLFYQLDAGHLRPVSRYTVVTRMVAELQTPDPKRQYFTGSEACGAQLQHYLDTRRAEPAEPSALRVRLGVIP